MEQAGKKRDLVSAVLWIILLLPFFWRYKCVYLKGSANRSYEPMVVFYHVLYPGMLYQHVCLPVKVMPTFVFVHRLFFSFSFFPNRNLLTMGGFRLPTVLVNMRTMWHYETDLIYSFNHLVFLCFYDSCIAVY
jgi:hypothetical protein